jgi:hypothetical protein
MNKKCSKCDQDKIVDDFHVDKVKHDGRRTICKACVYLNNVSYRTRFPEKVRERDRKWGEANREYRNAKYRASYSSSTLKRLKKNLRNRLVVAVKSNYQHTSAVGDLGCSIEEFKKYIEEQFEEGMGWDNWGRIGSNKLCWNIDHIKPISLATSEEELKKLVHYTNMRPLWAVENIRKGDFYEESKL